MPPNFHRFDKHPSPASFLEEKNVVHHYIKTNNNSSKLAIKSNR